MSHFVSIRDGQTNATESDLANMAVAFVSSGGGVVGTNDYLVQAQTSPDNTIKVGTGRAYVPTSDGTMVYSTLLDATANVTIAANSSGSTQIDAIVLYIDLSASPDANASNVAKFADVRGTSGSAPTNSEILTAIGSSNPYITLATISVANGFVSINTGNITDARTIVSLTTGQSVSVATYEEFTNQSGVVSTPASGKVRFYTKTSDKKPYYKDDGGNEFRVGTALGLKSATTTVDVSAATAPSAGQVLTATDSTHATWQGSSFIGCRVTRSSNKSYTSGSSAIVDWDAESFDTDSMHDNSTNKTRITINTAGKYWVDAHLVFVSSTSGVRECQIYKNGSAIEGGYWSAAANSTDAALVGGAILLDLAQNDYLEAEGYQNSGSSLNLQGNGDRRASSFSVYKIG